MNKIAVQTGGGWFDRSDPESSLSRIASLGFDAVDFNIDSMLDMKRLREEGAYGSVFDLPMDEFIAWFEPLKRASEKTGVEICQMHAPFPVYFHGLDETNKYLFSALDKCFALCEYLGCPAVVVHPTECETRAKELSFNLEFYKSLIPVVSKYEGVKICIENIFKRRPGKMIGEGRFSRADDLRDLIDVLNDEAKAELFGCCFDIGHANITRSDVPDFVRTLGHRLTIMHVHDNNGLNDLHMMPYSYLNDPSGYVCDWDGFVGALREIGYDGAIAFETFRVLRVLPPEVHNEALRLISAIGRTWAERINRD